MTVIVFLFGPILMGLCAAFGIVVRTRLRARADHRRIRGELEARAIQGTDGLVLLRGKLVVEGQACVAEAGDGNAKIAARTHWGSLRRLGLSEVLPSTNDRAETLWLETGKGRARIEGAVLASVGSRLIASGKPIFVDHQRRFDVVSKVMDGDEVWALCKRRDEAADRSAKATYREAATRVGVELVPDEDYCRLAVVSAPKISFGLASVMGHPAMVIALLLGLVPGWASAKDYEKVVSTRTTECSASGRCHVESVLHWNGLGGVKAMLRGQFFFLAAQDEADCIQSSQCMEYGRCTLFGSGCRAAHDEDCALSQACRIGDCSAIDGGCQVGKDADCKKWERCREHGACTAADLLCVIATDEDCRPTKDCREHGKCSAKSGACVAASDDDCVDSTDCKELGYCAADRGICVKSGKKCRSAPSCTEFGSCTADGFSCVARSVEDCQRSQGCAESQECILSDGACAFDAKKTCADSNACHVHGRCGNNKTGCIARSDQDCAQSLKCTTEGACKRFGDECAASCETSEACRGNGACAPSKGACVVASDADCQKSDACKNEGRCTLIDGVCKATDAECAKREPCRHEGRCSASDDGNTCRARKPADCKGSELCREEGACSIAKGACDRVSDEDCAATSACETDGKCTFVDKSYSSSCELGANDCKRLPVCNELGACSMVFEYGLPGCGATKDEECRESTVCKKFGWCTAVAGRCFVSPSAH